MSIYFGSNKIKLNLGDMRYHLNLIPPVRNNNCLITIDNKTLLDSNNLILIPKQEDNNSTYLLSSDNKILLDANHLNLVPKQENNPIIDNNTYLLSSQGEILYDLDNSRLILL